MRRYPIEFKESVIQKKIPPNAVSVSQLVKETGVSDVTLYKWRKEYREKGIAVPAESSKPENWSAEDKLAVVVETMPVNETDLGEYCRSRGLYVEQIEQWKQAALSGYQSNVQREKQNTLDHKKDQKKIKNLEAELKRKEKALAETVALLVLSKKCQAILEKTRKISTPRRTSDGHSFNNRSLYPWFKSKRPKIDIFYFV